MGYCWAREVPNNNKCSFPGFSSFQQVEYWFELSKQQAGENVVIFLVGSRSDLEHSRVVSQSEGQAAADRLGFDGYCECSSKENIGLDEMFEQICELVLAKDHISTPVFSSSVKPQAKKKWWKI
eukprot:TRINITY_DN3370_c0_g1_i2.p1 TRINITY_DN3370_c0_g1~~TRINITY_DN3370_c0_g1_i2.p1  ORF type:complete len:124 (-),score=22.61 TRINITY_DN3370_c0_g1_i2:33-404(-)